MEPKPPVLFRDKRPWGEELCFTDCDPSMVKLLKVSPGEALSLQYHNDRDEYWFVISGSGTATIGDKKIKLGPETECFVVRKTEHRIEGGDSELTILELAFGAFDEKDIVHLEDRYGRK